MCDFTSAPPSTPSMSVPDLILNCNTENLAIQKGSGTYIKHILNVNQHLTKQLSMVRFGVQIVLTWQVVLILFIVSIILLM